MWLHSQTITITPDLTQYWWIGVPSQSNGTKWIDCNTYKRTRFEPVLLLVRSVQEFLHDNKYCERTIKSCHCFLFISNFYFSFWFGTQLITLGINIEAFVWLLVLFISTSKQVLCMPFAGQNHLFWCFNKKRETQKGRKITWKRVSSYRCYS